MIKCLFITFRTHIKHNHVPTFSYISNHQWCSKVIIWNERPNKQALLSSSRFCSLCVSTFDLLWFIVYCLVVHPVQHVFFCLSCSHFYKPLLRKGCSKVVSQSAVFFLSAFFHEVRSENRDSFFVRVYFVKYPHIFTIFVIFVAFLMSFLFPCLSTWWVYLSGCSDFGPSWGWWHR